MKRLIYVYLSLVRMVFVSIISSTMSVSAIQDGPVEIVMPI